MSIYRLKKDSPEALKGTEFHPVKRQDGLYYQQNGTMVQYPARIVEAVPNEWFEKVGEIVEEKHDFLSDGAGISFLCKICGCPQKIPGSTIESAWGKEIAFPVCDSCLKDLREVVGQKRNIDELCKEFDEANSALEKTEHGLAIVSFKDGNNKDCSIQKSSIATEDCIWLGRDEYRMHLTQDMVKMLLPYLNAFVQTGGIKPIENENPNLFTEADLLNFSRFFFQDSAKANLECWLRQSGREKQPEMSPIERFLKDAVKLGVMQQVNVPHKCTDWVVFNDEQCDYAMALINYKMVDSITLKIPLK